jgi:hypothetical protein
MVTTVPLYPVARPDFELRGIDGSRHEQDLPSDILDLWQAFANLSNDARRQFLEVGSMWQLSLTLARDYETASYALKVVACEALKPRGSDSRDHNVYDVIEALLGKPTADTLRRDLAPQDVRNAHLHAGELRGDEFVQHIMMSSFQDPTFRMHARDLWQTTQAAIIEWLRRGGAVTLPPRRSRNKKTWQRRIAEKTPVLLPVCVLAGFVVGRFLTS